MPEGLEYKKDCCYWCIHSFKRYSGESMPGFLTPSKFWVWHCRKKDEDIKDYTKDICDKFQNHPEVK